VGPSTPFRFDTLAQRANIPARITLYELLSESTPRREGVNRCSANLRQMIQNLKLISNTQHVAKSESEFSVKGSETTPHDSSEL